GYWATPANDPGTWASGGAGAMSLPTPGGVVAEDGPTFDAVDAFDATSSRHLWPPSLQDLLTVDAFGVVHGGQPAILAGPTQEGALFTTKPLGHRVRVLAEARHELGFGLLAGRDALPPASPARLAFHDDILVVRAPPAPGRPPAEILAGTLYTSPEWTGPGT